jgi:hypothetical protein
VENQKERMGNPVSGTSSDSKVAGVKGECTGDGGFGVWGVCDSGVHGVFDQSTNNVGVAAEGHIAEAMNAACHSAKQAAKIAISCLETVIRS